MITQEFKERYICLYWGQEVVANKSESWSAHVCVNFVYQLITGVAIPKLRLRSLESITDEEAVEVAKILIDSEAEHEDIDNCIGFIFVTTHTSLPYRIEVGEQEMFVTKRSGIDWADVSIDMSAYGRCIDYLRSRSFALPYLGVSVDEMVKEGFVELIKN